MWLVWLVVVGLVLWLWCCYLVCIVLGMGFCWFWLELLGLFVNGVVGLGCLL